MAYKLIDIKLNQVLLYLGIVLFPFQNLSILLNSSYDFSAILLLSYIFLLSFEVIKKPMSIKFRRILKYFIVFIFVQLILFYFTDTPFYRLLSALVWFGGIALFFIFQREIKIDFLKTYKIIFISLLFTSFFIITDFFLFNIRPKAFFSEPSYAGLVLFSFSAAHFACYILNQNLLGKKSYTLWTGTFFFIISSLTKSMHIFTFLIVLTIVLFISIKKYNHLKIYLFLILSCLLLFTASIYQEKFYSLKLIFNADHYLLYPVDEAGLEHELNRSVLCWFDGFVQAVSAVMIDPFLGLGLGSTGFFNYESTYSALLIKYYGSNPNKFDTYSGLFRMIIELGFISTILILNAFLKKISLLKLKSHQTFEQVFIRVFSFALIIGILIKEPVYSRSHVYLAVLLFSASFIKPRKNIP